MTLRNLLYRCARCGQDPVTGRGDRVRCPACGALYERGGGEAAIRVRTPDGESARVPAIRLTEAIRDLGGPLPAARQEDGALRFRSRVRVRRSREEDAVRYRGRLVGFFEKLGPVRSATLHLVDDALELRDGESGAVTDRWSLLDLRAVQSSSSSVQIYTVDGELVQFGFPDESPLRWEALLHEVLRRAYRRAGKGEIVEFQPRIVTR